MNPYNNEWREMPSGYYADPAIKAREDERRRENRRRDRQQAREAGLEVNPWTDEQECSRCNAPVEPTGEGMAITCPDCGRVWDDDHPNGHIPA